MTHGKRIPVIVLTSSRNEDDRAMSYEKGVAGSTVKRVSFERLREAAQRIGDNGCPATCRSHWMHGGFGV